LFAAASAVAADASPPAIDLSTVAPAEETVADDDLGYLRWVLTEEQRARYASADADARRELLRIAWASLDPTPTTPENERRESFYRCLAYARERFPGSEEGGWDARGELLLRYGPPRLRVTSIGDDRTPPGETWIYDRLRAVFQLQDVTLQDRYILKGQRVSSRMDLALEYPIDAGTAVGNRIPKMPEPGTPAGRLQRAVERGQELLVKHPQVYAHDYGGDPLDVAHVALSFATGEPGTTRLEICTACRARDLEYAPADGGFEAVLDVAAVAKTPEYRELVRAERTTRDLEDSLEHLEGRVVLDRVDLLVEPGSRILALAVRDTASHRIGISQHPVEVTSFPPGELCISDVQVAYDISPGEPGDRFLKGDVRVTPWPFPSFPKDHDLFLYFEVYGLSPSPTDDTFFTVSLLLRPRGKKTASWFGSSKGQVIPGVESSWDSRGNGAVAREHIVLDTKTLAPGTYDVEITVTDNVGEGSARRTSEFTISD